MTTRAEPVPLAERLPALDVIRGFALFGILVVNMGFLGGPLAFALADPALAEGTFRERAAWWFENTFFMGKFVSTFSFLFGVGLALQMARLDRAKAEARADGRHGSITGLVIARRLVVLGLFGLVHGLLIWYGDILFYYAMLGWVLIFARYLSVRALTTIAICLAILSVFCMGGMSLLSLLGGKPEAQNIVTVALDAPIEADVLLANMKAAMFDTTNAAMASSEIAAYRNGTFESVLLLRGIQWVTMIPFMLIGFGTHVVALLVGGMAAAKANLFARDAVRAQTVAMAIGLPLGIIACAAASTMTLASGWKLGSPLLIAAAPVNEIGMIALAIGYIALQTRLVNAGYFPWLFARIACAGRMAFTVYLAESVLVTGLMYWWGLGYFGTFSRIEHFIIAFMTWVALTAFANLWLSVFRMGPLEWIWRAGTYFELPKMRRGSPASALAGDAA